jgi:RNA polymerase sigma factor (sigma-70 family)
LTLALVFSVWESFLAGCQAMSTASRNSLMNFLRAMVGAWREDRRDDAELLTCFAQTRDENAFTTLAWRYGGLVWRTCRSVLGEGPDAEDAFQTVFLTLARKSGQLRSATLPGWLYQVAQRAALDTLAGVRRRQDLERRLEALPRPTAEGDAGKAELYAALQEELAGLPERQRVPLVLRYLEGKTLEEVARILGCARTTLMRRLAKGEETLRGRLRQRGLTVATVAMGTLLIQAHANAAVPPRLLERVVEAALTSTPEGSKLLSLTVAVTALLLIGLGLIAAPWQAPTTKSDALPGRDEPPVVRKDAPAVQANRADIRGRVLSPDGKPIAGAVVTALAHRLFLPGEHVLHDEILTTGKTDDEGRFSLTMAADFPTWYPERRVALLVHAAGHPIHTEQVSLPLLAAGNPAPVEMRLPKPGTVEGWLRDHSGKPAQGVVLRVVRVRHVAFNTVAAGRPAEELAGWPKPVVTDVNGRFELIGVGESGGATFQVEDDRYAPHQFVVRSNKVEAATTLEPMRWIEGRVIAADTGAPLTGVRVSVHAFREEGLVNHTVSDEQIPRIIWTSTYDLRTDADGRFRARSFSHRPDVLEFYPPPGSPYLAFRKRVPPDAAGPIGDIVLPRGVVVRGRMIDEEGKPVGHGSVFWDVPIDPTNQMGDPAILREAYSIVRTDADGQFALTVQIGPVRLQAFGPGQDWITRPVSAWVRTVKAGQQIWRFKPPSTKLPSAYCHAETFLHLTADKVAPFVTLSLRKGRAIQGEVVAAAGSPIQRALLLCSGRVSPLRNHWGQPLLIERGRFVLPGCEEGTVYTVLALDTKQRQGGIARVSLDDPKSRIQLKPCGVAQVRIDARGQPLPTTFPTQYPYLFLHLPKPYPIGAVPENTETDLVDDSGIDTFAMHDNRRLSEDGELSLPFLIPDARYLLSWRLQMGQSYLPWSRSFSVKPGELLKLPTIIPNEPAR